MANLSRICSPDSWRYQRVTYSAHAAADPRGGVEVAAQKAVAGATLNTTDYATTVHIVGPDVPRQKVGWWDSQASSPTTGKTTSSVGVVKLLERMAAVPIPESFAPASGTDAQAVIWQPSTDTVWELWRTRVNDPLVWNPKDPDLEPFESEAKNSPGDVWQITWGGRVDNVSANLSTGFREADPALNGSNYLHGTAASGLMQAPGLITPGELSRGVIPKAPDISLIQVAKLTTTTTRDGLSWPGYRTDGGLVLAETSPYGGMVLREGQRLVMDRGVSTEGMHPVAATITTALQTYGCVIRDRAGAVTLSGQSAHQWTDRGQVDPYAALFAGTPKYEVMNQVPWGSLRALPKDHGKPA